MPNNMIVRVVADASGFSKGMEQATRKAAETGRKMKKALSMSELSAEAARIMGWGSEASRINTITASNVGAAMSQMQTLSAYRDMLADIGFEDAQVSEVSTQINRLSAALDAYKQEAVATTQAEHSSTAAAAQLAQAVQTAGASASQSSWHLSAFQRAGQALRGALGSLQPDIHQLQSVGESAESSEADLTAMQRAAHRLRGTLAAMGGAAKHGLSWLVSLPKKFGSGAWSGLKTLESHLSSIGRRVASSNAGLGKMVRSIRNISLSSFAFNVAHAAIGRLRSIVSEYVNDNAALKAQIDALKSSMGQALAPAINLVASAMSALMPYVVGISNAISSLMGSLMGNGWAAAAAGAKETAAATNGAAAAQKEMSRQLMGFDQINRTDDQSDSSGSESATPAATISAKTPKWLETYQKAFTDTFTSLDFQAASVGGKIGMTLNTAIGTTLGMIGDFSFEPIGEGLAENFNDFLAAVDWSAAGQLVGRAFLIVPQTIVGFIRQSDWALVGTSISDCLIGAVSTGAAWIASTDWIGLGESLWTLVTGIDWAGVASTLGYLLGTAIGAAAGLLWGFVKHPWDAFVEICKENAEANGGNMVLGILQGILDGLKNIGTWLWDNLAKPIINGVKDAFGIHSPSTVFAEFGQYLMQGLTNGITADLSCVLEKLQSLKDKVLGIAASLKNAFSFEWSMPSLKLPHLQVNWDPVDSVVARFFGVTAIPSLSVSWFAKGGILDGAQIFGAMGSTLLGGGEAGREAILPLDSNTGWMDDLARRVASLISTDGGAVSAVINIILDGKKITSYVIKDLRNRSRSGTVCLG